MRQRLALVLHGLANRLDPERTNDRVALQLASFVAGGLTFVSPAQDEAFQKAARDTFTIHDVDAGPGLVASVYALQRDAFLHAGLSLREALDRTYRERFGASIPAED